MNIPKLNIKFVTNIKNIKEQNFHPKMLKVAQSQIYIIPFFELTKELIDEFNKNKVSMLELFTNKQYLIQLIDFLKDRVKMPKTTEKKVENTSNTIKLLINEIFKKNTIFYLANNKYRIYDINIENINTTPIKNTYNSKISLVMVHAYKDQKGTDSFGQFVSEGVGSQFRKQV